MCTSVESGDRVRKADKDDVAPQFSEAVRKGGKGDEAHGWTMWGGREVSYWRRREKS